MAGLRPPSESAGLEVRLLHAAALERTSPRTQRGHSAGPGHSTRGGAGAIGGGDHLLGRRGVRRPGRIAAATQSLPGRGLGRCLRAAHQPPRSSLSVPRRAALRRLASGRRTTAGGRGRRVASGAGVAGVRPGRLGGPRGGRAGGAAAGPGRVPEAEQEGRPRSQVRAIRAAAVGRERDAADRGRRARQRLPDRPAAAQEAVLTEDRDARQALQAVVPDREDPGGRRECVRVGGARSSTAEYTPWTHRAHLGDVVAPNSTIPVALSADNGWQEGGSRSSSALVNSSPRELDAPRRGPSPLARWRGKPHGGGDRQRRELPSALSVALTCGR